MRATAGDRIVLAGEVLDQPTRSGEVLEVRGAGGEPPWVVRWDDGHTSTLYPGPGMSLKVTGPPASGHGHEVVARPELGTTREWSVRVSIFEKGDDTTATVALLADSPEALTARGATRRAAADDGVAHIGDEVAVARALHRLADHLLARAEHDIEERTGEHGVSVRTR